MSEEVQFLSTAWAIVAAIVCYKTPLRGGLGRNLLFFTPLAMLPIFLKYKAIGTLPMAIGLTTLMAVAFVGIVVLGYRLERKLGIPGFQSNDE